MSAPEAIWRIFEFKMHDISHAIIRLAVHLPDEQAVYFQPGGEQVALEAASSKETTLTAWFKLNQQDPSANQYLYSEIPENFVFDKASHSWQPRIKYCKLISRMYTVSLNEPERYYLRLLLLNIRGATSFDFRRISTPILRKSFSVSLTPNFTAEFVSYYTLKKLTTMGWLLLSREAGKAVIYLYIYHQYDLTNKSLKPRPLPTTSKLHPPKKF